MSVTFYNKKDKKIFTVSGFPPFGEWTDKHSNFVNLVCNTLGCTYMPTKDRGIPFDLLEEVFK